MQDDVDRPHSEKAAQRQERAWQYRHARRVPLVDVEAERQSRILGRECGDFSRDAASLVLSPTSLERSRTYLYLRGAHSVLVAAVAWWFQGWIVAAILGSLFAAMGHFSYQHLSIFRKLALFFVLLDYRSISLRRKLPVEQ